MTDIGAFQIDDPLIAAQLPGQLAVAHIDSIYPGRSVLQHTVGKTASGSADIGTDEILQPQVKFFYRLFQLQSAAADICQLVAAELNLILRRYRHPRFIRLLAVDIHLSGHDNALCAVPSGTQAPLHQGSIQSCFLRHSRSAFSPP